MKISDTIYYSLRATRSSPVQTFLMLLAMGIGVASVMVLTALGEGARLYVIREFQSLGTHLLVVIPGRTETTGGPPPILGNIPRDLTIEDSESIYKYPSVSKVAPLCMGSALISHKIREREAPVLGTTWEMLEIRQLTIASGRFIPKGDPSRQNMVCVLGHTLATELFGNEHPVGQRVRIGDRQFRVIGILSPKGQSLGLEIGEIAIVPVASALSIFNTSSLFRILVQAKSRHSIDRVKTAILKTIRDRHEGEDDITVITQDAVLSTFDRILFTLTVAVSGIASISLAVAGILIMNVMFVSVSKRTTEIGLLKAIGAPSRQILRIFLSEAALLSGIGAALGIIFAILGIRALSAVFPTLPLSVPLWASVAAIATALFTGLIFGVLPARRAARLDPVMALYKR